MERKKVGILVFPDVEVLDFAGPFEVFSATRLNEESRYSESSPFEVFLIAERVEPILAAGGLRLLPDRSIADCPHLDILVVPGGWGTRTQVNNPGLIDWIRDQGTRVGTLASVCTGSFLLGKAGLLDRVAPPRTGVRWTAWPNPFRPSPWCVICTWWRRRTS